MMILTKKKKCFKRSQTVKLNKIRDKMINANADVEVDKGSTRKDSTGGGGGARAERDTLISLTNINLRDRRNIGNKCRKNMGREYRFL